MTRVQIKSGMQDKQKVTLYIPPGLHRQLKIRAAIESDSMSAVVEKAISFYLEHPEKVEEVEADYGRTHQVHICPECDAAMVLRESRMVSLKDQPSVIDEEFPMGVRPESKEEEQLVPC